MIDGKTRSVPLNNLSSVLTGAFLFLGVYLNKKNDPASYFAILKL